MAYNECNPLLPRNNPAPEVQFSRAQSVNDDVDRELWRRDQREVRIRTNTLSFIMGLITISFLTVLLNLDGLKNMWRNKPWSSRTIDERVNSILAQTPLIDGHNDLAILIRFIYNNHIYNDNFTEPFTKGGMIAHVDLPRLKIGKVGGTFWAAYIPCPANGTDFSDDAYTQSVASTYNQIDLLKRLQAQYPTNFSPPPNSSTALSAFQNGQLISPLAIEGLHQIGNSISNLRNYFSLGARYASLTHNCHNKYADAALTQIPGGIEKARPYWGGVSTEGRALIHEMNRMGMIVDLAHVSEDTMRDVLGAGNGEWSGSAAPIIFSHSSAYAICPHPRNVPDGILQLVKQRKSLVMINFSPDFISCVKGNNENGLPDYYPGNGTIAQVVDHINYIGKLIGYDHVGLGSDFDGILKTPKGLEDVSKFPDLVGEMLRQNISDTDAAKVVGGNLLRVWAAVDAVAMKLQAGGELPLEDDLPDF